MTIKKLKTMNFGGEDTYELTPEWDKIENKPFGEEVVYGDTVTMSDLEVDETTTKAFTDVMSEFFGGATFNCYELKTTKDSLIGGALFSYSTPDGNTMENDDPTGGNTQVTNFTNYEMVTVNGMLTVFITNRDNIELEGDYEGIIVPKAGVWLLDMWSMQSLTFNSLKLYNGSFETTKTVPIPNKYLPEHLQFGEEEKTLIDNKTYSYSESDMMYLIDSFNVQNGATYKVIYNGVETVCQAKEMDGLAYIGNVSIMNPEFTDTGESFIIVDFGRLIFVPNDGNTEDITLSIVVIEIDKLDNKYLEPFNVNDFGVTNTFIPLEHTAIGGMGNLYSLGNTTRESLIGGYTVTYVYQGKTYTKTFTSDDLTGNTETYEQIGDFYITYVENVSAYGGFVTIPTPGVYLIDSYGLTGGEVKSIVLTDGAFNVTGQRVKLQLRCIPTHTHNASEVVDIDGIVKGVLDEKYPKIGLYEHRNIKIDSNGTAGVIFGKCYEEESNLEISGGSEIYLKTEGLYLLKFVLNFTAEEAQTISLYVNGVGTFPIVVEGAGIHSKTIEVFIESNGATRIGIMNIRSTGTATEGSLYLEVKRYPLS